MDDINETPVSEQQIVVSLEFIKASLKKGVTRRIDDPGYMAEIGSIQEIYNMNKAEVTALFGDERLKGLKVSRAKPSRILIAEDIVSESALPVSAPEAIPVVAEPATMESTEVNELDEMAGFPEMVDEGTQAMSGTNPTIF